MRPIAGHSFDGVTGECACGRRFSDIAGAEFADVGKMYVAHSGALTQHEFEQIVSERERLWRSLTGAPAVEIPQLEDNSIFG
jgi:hypothetical protein